MCRIHGGSAPQVKAKARERYEEGIKDLIDPDRVLRTAAALAYSDVTDLYDEHYNLKPMRDWPPALRQAIKRIEPRLANVDPGDGAADKVLRLELHDKIKPLELLAKHLNLLTERMDLKAKVVFGWENDEA